MQAQSAVQVNDNWPMTPKWQSIADSKGQANQALREDDGDDEGSAIHSPSRFCRSRADNDSLVMG